MFTKLRFEDKDLEDSSRKIFWLRKFLGADSIERGFDPDNRVEVESECPWTNSRRPRCIQNSKYRTVDGSCNNAENPLLGMAGTPFRRLLGSTYPRFDNTPRKAVDGSQLPSAREVTQTVFSQYAGIGPVDTPQCCLKDPVGRDHSSNRSYSPPGKKLQNI